MASSTNIAPAFDASRARLSGPDLFSRFRVTGDGELLSSARLDPKTPLLVFDRAGQRRALLRSQMAYRHVAQGQLAGEHYTIAFCAVCNIGVGLTPVLDGKVHHFSLGGLYNGMMLMIDDESRSYWDYVTGQAVYGELTGVRLQTWTIEMSDVASAVQRDPRLRLHRMPCPLWGRFVAWAARYFDGRLPPGFQRTMGDVDRRLPEMELGLGVVTDRSHRFYPLRTIGLTMCDRLDERGLEIRRGDNGTAVATWDDGTRPNQFVARWYAFSLSFPDCHVCGVDAE